MSPKLPLATECPSRAALATTFSIHATSLAGSPLAAENRACGRRIFRRGPPSELLVRKSVQSGHWIGRSPSPLCAMCGRLPVGKGFLDALRFGRCGHVFDLLMRRT